jgi:hypothetical protein
VLVFFLNNTVWSVSYQLRAVAEGGQWMGCVSSIFTTADSSWGTVYRGFCRHFDCMITKGRRIQCDGSEQEAMYEATTRWMSTFNITVGAESITNFFRKVRELIFKYLFSKHDKKFFFHFTHTCNSYIWEGRSLEIFNRFVDMLVLIWPQKSAHFILYKITYKVEHPKINFIPFLLMQIKKVDYHIVKHVFTEIKKC